jgi:hypothetical protein
VNSGKPEHANPGVRLAVLDRKAKTGKRFMRGVQAIGILSDIPIAHLRGDQIVASDVVGGSAGELIGFFNNVIVKFEQRQNIFDSTSHVVKMVRAGHPARCLVELDTDESQETCKVRREHRPAPITDCGSNAQSLHGSQANICAELSICRIAEAACVVAPISREHRHDVNSCCDKMEAPATT